MSDEKLIACFLLFVFSLVLVGAVTSCKMREMEMKHELLMNGKTHELK